MLTAAEARAQGDATIVQRAELQRLLETKRYPLEWRDQLFADIRAAGGLSTTRATSVINWLVGQPEIAGGTVRADTVLVERIQILLRQRIAPGPWARQIRDRITAGTLSTDEASMYLRDLERLPQRAFIAPTDLQPAAAGTDVPDGYYALTEVDGPVRCYRIHTMRSGQRTVDLFLSDQPGPRRMLRSWQATLVLRAVAVDVAAAARLFAATRTRCSDCNQPLHDEGQAGFGHGYGPDCWARRVAAGLTAPASTP